MRVLATVVASLALAGAALAAPTPALEDTVNLEVLPPTNCLNRILQVVTGADKKSYNFATLAKLGYGVDYAVRTLAGTDPSMPSNITVFAPTDDAFKTFVASVGGSLPKSLEPLVPEILSYHISGSYIDLASLPAVSGIATLLNNTGNLSTVSPQLLLATKGGNTSVLSYGLGTAEVIDTLQCTNGVVQVVSSVLYPPNPTSTTLDLLNATAMAGIVDRAGLAPALDRDDRTLFVPTDEAFAAYSKAAGLDRQGRRALVRYHTVTKRIMSWDFDSLKAVTVGEDIDLPVRVEKGEVFVAGAKVVKANVLTANGVIHVIDRVLV